MKSHLKMALESMDAFSNDSKMDEFELQNIFELALKDGVVDDDEKRILNGIIRRLNDVELTPDMEELIIKINKFL